MTNHQVSFSPNWISLDVVIVEVNKPALGLGAPVESKMFVLSGVTGREKFRLIEDVEHLCSKLNIKAFTDALDGYVFEKQKI